MAFDPRRVKKDAFYKPLFRRFRATLRQLMDQYGLSKNHQHMRFESVRDQVWLFMQKI